MHDLMNKYKELEFTLVTELTRVYDTAKELHMQEIQYTIENEIKRVKEKNFKVIVVGEFKRGKSTLINALLKCKVLPADIVPTTATINRVAYDPNPFVQLYFKDGTKQNLDINKLSDYVTKLTPEGEAMASKIEEAVIFYPTPFCQNNIYIIDTPGLCDDDAMTKVTMNAIATADAAIMVISALSPFSLTECAFVTNLILDSKSICRLVFAVNFIDKLDEDEVDRILDYAKKRIYSNVIGEAFKRYGDGTDEFKRVASIMSNAPVFGVSANLALNAYTSNDKKKLSDSRFTQFEQELQNILATEQGLSAIRVPFEKMIYSCDSIIEKIDAFLVTNEKRYKDNNEEAFNNEFSKYEEKMQKIVEELRSHSSSIIKDIRDKCSLFLRELYQGGLDCFEKIGIQEANFSPAIIDSYFKYVNDTMKNFQNKLFTTHAVPIQMEIIRISNEYIGKLNEVYRDIFVLAEKYNLNIIDKMQQHEFMFYLERYPFPEYTSGFILPTDISTNGLMRQRFGNFLNAYSYRINIRNFWENSIVDAMNAYKNSLINSFQCTFNETTQEYLKNYNGVILQIRSSFAGQVNLEKERYITAKHEQERKKQTMVSIREKSCALLDMIKENKIDFEME